MAINGTLIKYAFYLHFDKRFIDWHTKSRQTSQIRNRKKIMIKMRIQPGVRGTGRPVPEIFGTRTGRGRAKKAVPRSPCYVP